MKSRIVFSFDRRLHDYTPDEVKFLDQMHKDLTAFNATIPEEAEEYEGDLHGPDYTEEEMITYSHYRELLIRHSIDNDKSLTVNQVKK